MTKKILVNQISRIRFRASKNRKIWELGGFKDWFRGGLLKVSLTDSVFGI